MTGSSGLPNRKKLPHTVPSWVKDGSIYFITIACEERGRNILCNEEFFTAMTSAFLVYEKQGKFTVRLFLAMPDHVHFLVVFNPYEKMADAINLWKSYTARTLGFRWQSGFFDHRLRNPHSLDEKGHYIRNNPVRAGLIDTAEEWCYVWENSRL